MTTKERGLMLLCCSLGDERAQPLQQAEFSLLEQRLQDVEFVPDEELNAYSLRRLGFDSEFSERVAALMNRERWLDGYLTALARAQVRVVTRLSPEYPKQLLRKLREAAPAVLFCRGDVKLLQEPGVSLVGSRALLPLGEAFAARVGTLCAQEGFTLISGGARGADSVAQRACLSQGGQSLIFVADRLMDHPPERNTLYCSLDDCTSGFTAARAHARNRLIHAMGEKTFVAQCTLNRGGTWRGTRENLKKELSPVFCHADGSEAAHALVSFGAVPVQLDELKSLRVLQHFQSRMD